MRARPLSRRPPRRRCASLSLSLPHTHAHARSHTHTHTHTHIGERGHLLSPRGGPVNSRREAGPHTHTHSHTLTHTLTHSHTHTLTHTLTLTPTLTLALTHSHTHTLTLSHTHSHTHSKPLVLATASPISAAAILGAHSRVGWPDGTLHGTVSPELQRHWRVAQRHSQAKLSTAPPPSHLPPRSPRNRTAPAFAARARWSTPAAGGGRSE